MTDLVTGDTGSILSLTITDKTTGSAVNLTGATVRVHWRDAAGALVTGVATITNAAGGLAEYQFTSGQIFAPLMVFEVEVTDSAGKITTGVDTITKTVREQIG